MSDGSKIEWTDATWNPITGCSVKSPGCKHCYAMLLAGTRLSSHPSRAGLTVDTVAGPVWTGEVRFNPQWLDQPLRWKRPRMIFVCAHGDLFHEAVPDEWIDQVFAVMALCPQHIFQVLTKRADRMRVYLSDADTPGRIDRHQSQFYRDFKVIRRDGLGKGRIRTFASNGVLPNLWLGVSVEDQLRAEERIPDLLAIPAAVRWVSCEPLLGPVDLSDLSLRVSERFFPGSSGLVGVDALTGIHWDAEDTIVGLYGNPDPRIDWVVVGGESGPKSRPMHPQWARMLRDQCQNANVPYFFKQWGDWLPEGQFDATGFQWAPGEDGKAHWWKPEPPVGSHLEDGHCSIRVGKSQAGRSLDRILHNGVPS